MRTGTKVKRRPGAIVPLVALCLVGLLGMVALAIDLALIMIARNQAQCAADAGALAGARTLNGNTSNPANLNNKTTAVTNAQTVAQANYILSAQVTSGQVGTVNIGDYYYDYTANAFKINLTALGSVTDNYNLAQVSINYNTGPTFFSTVFGTNGFTTGATATAIHRPRDVVIVQDFSGSMRLDSMMGMPKNADITQTMLPLPQNDGAGNAGYPLFGHYSATATAQLSALDYPPTGPPSGYYVNDTGELCSPGNLVNDTGDGPAIVKNYYADTTALGSTTQAFTASSNSYASVPGGDQWMRKTFNTNASAYAATVNDIVGSGVTFDLLWELDGYAAYANGVANPNLNNQVDYSNAPFYGFTEGPGYWGKTFMIWPPDPRAGPLTNATQVKNFVMKILGLGSITAGSVQEGIYKSNAVAGSTNWGSWTSANLSNYLKNKVGLTAGVANQQYERIMRLFNRGYPGGPSAGAFSADWRARFFLANDGVTPLVNNLRWDGTGNLLPPCDSGGAAGSNNNYRINYPAILAWMAQPATNPTNVFPAQLRSGGIKYYGSIPTTMTTATFPPSNTDQRFWKEYIDEVLGLQQTGLNGDGTPNYQVIVNGNTCQFGLGLDYTWGTVQVSAPPASGTPIPYMVYGDNPLRGRAKGWFGGMTFVGFLSNWNMNRWWWSGTCTEAPTFQCKLGMQAALNDIGINHPNDIVAQVFFSTPIYGQGQGGQFNTARVPLGRNFTLMQQSEWFHPWTIANPTSEFTPYDSQNNDGNFPRAGGGTCYAMGLMLAHNQLSSNSTLRTATKPTATSGIAGGLGRIGASKLIILESDGACKDKGSSTLDTSGGAYNSFWNVVVTDSSSPSGGGNYPGGSGVDFGAAGTISGTPGNYTVTGASGAPGDALNVAVKTVNLTSAGGLSSGSKKVVIHCIAFGSLFDPNNTSTRQATCLSLMHNLEVLGGVQPVSGGATPSGIANYKIVLGAWNSAWPTPGRVQLMQQAFQNIMADGFQVVLISTSNTLP
jgi:Flp pilus assembly protein TadG